MRSIVGNANRDKHHKSSKHRTRRIPKLRRLLQIIVLDLAFKCWLYKTDVTRIEGLNIFFFRPFTVSRSFGLEPLALPTKIPIALHTLKSCRAVCPYELDDKGQSVNGVSATA